VEVVPVREFGAQRKKSRDRDYTNKKQRMGAGPIKKSKRRLVTLAGEGERKEEGVGCEFPPTL